MSNKYTNATIKLACKYCEEGVHVSLIRNGTIFLCPVCETLYANCPEIIEQLTQAAKKNARAAKNEFIK